MPPRFTRLAELAAAVVCGDPDRLRGAASNVVEQDGETALREVLRLLHLFYGFPTTVRALGMVSDLLAPATPGAEDEPASPKDSRLRGEEVFRHLYGRDAEPVLEELLRLDPLLRGWILGHAYGAVFGRPGLGLEEKERLALLALADTACWRQWESHARNAFRLGLPAELLEQDLTRADWLGPESVTRAREALQARQRG